MYKYDDKSSNANSRLQGPPLNLTRPGGSHWNRVTAFPAAYFGSARSAYLSGLGDPPDLQIVSSSPNIGDLVDYLDATVRVRARVTVPTNKVNFLVLLDPPDKPTWWKRLWEDPLKIFPEVRVTIELVQVGSSLTPISQYQRFPFLTQGLNQYLMKLHSKDPCTTDYVTALGAPFLINTQKSIEQDLGIDGKLDTLLKKANIKLPMSGLDQQRHFWVVYATFPTDIRKYVIPEDLIVLDKFAFDKSDLTKIHVGKIIAIARHAAALTKFVGTAPKIALAGHTDSRGTEKYNVDLGNRRAAAVKDALGKALDGVSTGLSAQTSVDAKSFGETKPLVKARTEAEHALNRRVEVAMQKTLPRCPRVSLRAVVKRAQKLLPRLSDAAQIKRLDCVLKKLIQKGSDDRWMHAQGVLDVYNSAAPLGTYPFSLLRDQLTMQENYGPAVPDAAILKNLEGVDARIQEGIAKVVQLITILSNAASQGIPLIATMKAMDTLRAWMNERVNNDASIYSCYK